MPARHILLAGAALSLLLYSMPAPAQSLIKLDLSDSGVIEPMGGPAAQLSLVNTSALNFGRFAAGSGGSITIAPTGARSRSGGVILMNSAGTGSAAFTLTTLNGSGASKAVIVSLPGDGVVSLSNGQLSMPVRNFVSGSGTVFTLTPAGAVLNVGATLTVAPNQPAGSYSGSFQVTVNYQ
jgi:hypothetical protein